MVDVVCVEDNSNSCNKFDGEYDNFDEEGVFNVSLLEEVGVVGGEKNKISELLGNNCLYSDDGLEVVCVVEYRLLFFMVLGFGDFSFVFS